MGRHKSMALIYFVGPVLQYYTLDEWGVIDGPSILCEPDDSTIGSGHMGHHALCQFQLYTVNGMLKFT